MKLLYEIIINGTPVPQARVRSTILKAKDGRQWINHYTPAASANYKKFLQSEMTKKGLPETLLDEALILEVLFYTQKPKSSKRLWVTVKPDLDNYIKAVKDAMNGLIYRDDSIIIGYRNCFKLYNDNPRTEIKLYKAGT
jgi:Holliday junction resolvase RusA-like endonuclease